MVIQGIINNLGSSFGTKSILAVITTRRLSNHHRKNKSRRSIALASGYLQEQSILMGRIKKRNTHFITYRRTIWAKSEKEQAICETEISKKRRTFALR